MDTDELYGKVERWLSTYEDDFESIFDNNAGQKRIELDDKTQRMKVVSILLTEEKIGWILTDLERRGRDITSLQNRYQDIESYVEKFRESRGDDLQEVYRRRFEELYEKYPRTVWNAFHQTPIKIETLNDIVTRDVLQFVYDELEIDDPAIDEGIRMLDEALKFKYRVNTDLVEEFDIERPYYPDHYWWRHPEQVITED